MISGLIQIYEIIDVNTNRNNRSLLSLAARDTDNSGIETRSSNIPFLCIQYYRVVDHLSIQIVSTIIYHANSQLP